MCLATGSKDVVPLVVRMQARNKILAAGWAALHAAGAATGDFCGTHEIAGSL